MTDIHTPSSSQPSQNPASSDPSAPAPGAQPAAPKSHKSKLALLGVVATVVAWALFFYHPLGAVVAALVGLILSVIGVTAGRGCMRDVSITSLIASAVLVVVYAVFTWWLPHLVAGL